MSPSVSPLISPANNTKPAPTRRKNQNSSDPGLMSCPSRTSSTHSRIPARSGASIRRTSDGYDLPPPFGSYVCDEQPPRGRVCDFCAHVYATHVTKRRWRIFAWIRMAFVVMGVDRTRLGSIHERMRWIEQRQCTMRGGAWRQDNVDARGDEANGRRRKRCMDRIWRPWWDG